MLARNVRVELVRAVPADAVLVDDDAVEVSTKAIRQWLRAAGYSATGVRLVRSRRHQHFIVRVRPRPRSLHERIALQLLLGSDKHREANNLRRAMALSAMPRRGQASANVLYE